MFSNIVLLTKYESTLRKEAELDINPDYLRFVYSTLQGSIL